jgi:YHS domain-containing protein
MTKDPVCGKQVDEKNAPTSTYQGKQYSFCGEQDKQKFDGNPQQYAKSQQSGDAGKSGQQGDPGQSGHSGQSVQPGQQQKRSGGGAGGGM